MNIILIGPPGAGKGTIAQALQKEFSLPQISTGDLIRAEIKAQTELGKKVMEFVNNGKLAPDNLIIELTQNRLKQKDCKEGFILDGFPRTLNQARAITTANVQIDYVLNLKVSKETILKR